MNREIPRETDTFFSGKKNWKINWNEIPKECYNY
jgi:hypothetical protein